MLSALALGQASLLTLLIVVVQIALLVRALHILPDVATGIVAFKARQQAAESKQQQAAQSKQQSEAAALPTVASPQRADRPRTSSWPAAPDAHCHAVLAKFFGGLSRSAGCCLRRVDEVQEALDDYLFGSGSLRLCCDAATGELLTGDTPSARASARPTAPGSVAVAGTFLGAADDADRLQLSFLLAGLGTVEELAGMVMGLASFAAGVGEAQHAALGAHVAARALPHLAASGEGRPAAPCLRIAR